MFSFLLCYSFWNNSVIQLLLVSGSLLILILLLNILGWSTSLCVSHPLVSVLPFWNTQYKYTVSSMWWAFSHLTLMFRTSLRLHLSELIKGTFDFELRIRNWGVQVHIGDQPTLDMQLWALLLYLNPSIPQISHL